MDWDGEDECALNAYGLISERQRAGISSVVHEARYGGSECLKARGAGGRRRRCDGPGWDEEGDADATDGLGGYRQDAESGGWMSSSSDDDDAFWDIKYRLRSHWRYCSQEASDSDGEGWSAGLKAAAVGGACVGSASDAATDATVDVAVAVAVAVAVPVSVAVSVAGAVGSAVDVAVSAIASPMAAVDATATVATATIARAVDCAFGAAVKGGGPVSLLSESIRTGAGGASESARRPAGTR